MTARALKTGGVTGLVVTASHNPVADNGVKLVDPSGYMLEQAWEVGQHSTCCAKQYMLIACMPTPAQRIM